jgi:hypothetical protein
MSGSGVGVATDDVVDAEVGALATGRWTLGSKSLAPVHALNSSATAAATAVGRCIRTSVPGLVAGAAVSPTQRP